MFLCVHTLSLADMCHTVGRPAALVLVLRETAEEAKKQQKNGLSTLWRSSEKEQGEHGQRFAGLDTPCAEFACLTVGGSAY